MYEDAGRTGAGEGEEGQEEEEAERGTERSEAREGEGDMDLEEKRSTRTLWKQGQEIRGAVGIKSPLSVTEEEEGRNRGRRTPKKRSRGGRGATGL